MTERDFQTFLRGRIKAEFPSAVILKNDPTFLQGVPDLIVLHDGKWAALECKASAKANHQPNQDYWVDRMNRMSFSAFVYPENVEKVLDQLVDWFVEGVGGYSS